MKEARYLDEAEINRLLAFDGIESMAQAKADSIAAKNAPQPGRPNRRPVTLDTLRREKGIS
jgi:hypothetical protein